MNDFFAVKSDLLSLDENERAELRQKPVLRQSKITFGKQLSLAVAGWRDYAEAIRHQTTMGKYPIKLRCRSFVSGTESFWKATKAIILTLLPPSWFLRARLGFQRRDWSASFFFRAPGFKFILKTSDATKRLIVVR